MSKVLIYKTGRSETLSEDSPSDLISLGDVLRTTPILHSLPRCEIHWITSKEAMPLLEGIENIDSVCTIDQFDQRLASDIDILINLEKDSMLKEKFRFSDHMKEFGFMENDFNMVSTLREAVELKTLLARLNAESKPTLQDFLFELLGENFKGQEYLISAGVNFIESSVFRIGLNWKVGKKWPDKTPKKEAWSSLAQKIENQGLSISWQTGFEDLNEYISWINSNSLIITADSLGMHIALALRKPTLVLFGPTGPKEIYDYGNLYKYKFDVPKQYDCLPCYSKVCHMEKSCNLFLKEDKLLETINEIIRQI